MTTGT
jgi:NADH dehydrogenase FAD-containing subunit